MSLPYNPLYHFLRNNKKFGLLPFRSPLLRQCALARVFLYSSAYWDVSLQRVYSSTCVEAIAVCAIRFPHSEIPGSKVAKHLPEAYRSYATSFIATLCQGIHHTPLWAPSVQIQRRIEAFKSRRFQGATTKACLKSTLRRSNAEIGRFQSSASVRQFFSLTSLLVAYVSARYTSLLAPCHKRKIALINGRWICTEGA